MRIAIIGAGIGGLTAAVALHARGHHVTVHERARELSGSGAGLTLWPNATATLGRMGAIPAPFEAGWLIGSMEVQSWRGDLLARVDVAGMDDWLGSPSVMVHRGELQRALVDQLPADILHLGQECIAVGSAGTRATAHFADGRQATVDLLVAADGIHSIARATLAPRVRPRYAGYTCWRGIADLDAPIGESGAVLAAGRGTQCGIFRMTGGRCYWFLTRNAPEGDRSTTAREAATRALLEWPYQFAEPLAATDPAAILWDDIYDLAPLPRWHSGRIVLLGDAAHAMTPNLGQGAGLAIEDALALADSLGELVDPSDALALYADRRKRRAEDVVRHSRQVGRRLQLTNPAMCWLRDRTVRTAPALVQRNFERVPSTGMPPAS